MGDRVPLVEWSGEYMEQASVKRLQDRSRRKPGRSGRMSRVILTRKPGDPSMSRLKWR